MNLIIVLGGIISSAFVLYYLGKSGYDWGRNDQN
ncbi:hypothetical protein JOC83_002373 [Bacillus iocasae]|uniref:NADH dehydrogenase subunit 3 n=1 Tax=Priestia iocasae TaxID=2291674 RepID=A0ABS2QVK8_9BACI|nr:hypothetical protein [Metabacillus iocasae]